MAVNSEYATATDSQTRHVICMKFRMKLSKLWETRQDLFSPLVSVCGNYDDYLLHLRNYAEGATVADSIFIGEALKVNIIQVDHARRKIHWPSPKFKDCIVIAWRDGSCHTASFDGESIVPIHYFAPWKHGVTVTHL